MLSRRDGGEIDPTERDGVCEDSGSNTFPSLQGNRKDIGDSIGALEFSTGLRAFHLPCHNCLSLS